MSNQNHECHLIRHTPHCHPLTPSQLHRDQCCGYALDVWQAGQTVLAMASGRRPWRHCYMDVHPEYKKHALAKVCRGRSREKVRRGGGGVGLLNLWPNNKGYIIIIVHGCLHTRNSFLPKSSWNIVRRFDRISLCTHTCTCI